MTTAVDQNRYFVSMNTDGRKIKGLFMDPMKGSRVVKTTHDLQGYQKVLDRPFAWLAAIHVALFEGSSQEYIVAYDREAILNENPYPSIMYRGLDNDLHTIFKGPVFIMNRLKDGTPGSLKSKEIEYLKGHTFLIGTHDKLTDLGMASSAILFHGRVFHMDKDV